VPLDTKIHHLLHTSPLCDLSLLLKPKWFGKKALFYCVIQHYSNVWWLITTSQKSHYKILDLLFNLVVTILQCCNLQQTCKPWKNSKVLNLLWSITTTQHKKYNKKASDTKKKRTEKWFILEQPNHPTLHILGKQLGAKLRCHVLSLLICSFKGRFHISFQ
jgi:hypothetical protein